jgi:hypothetical protein
MCIFILFITTFPMKYNTKKKAMSVFILVVFAFSTIAIAFLQVFNPGGPSDTPDDTTNVDTTILSYDRLLTPSEEQAYLQQDIVAVRFFFNADCDECGKANTITNQLANDLVGRVLIEKIDADQNPVGVTVPSFVVKGSTSTNVEEIDYAMLRKAVCEAYFSAPDSCN